MDVLGHEDVGVDAESVRYAGLFEDVFEDLFGVVGGEVREAVVAAEGDEGDVSGFLVTLQALGHGGRLEAVDLPVDDPLMARGCREWGTRLWPGS